MSASHDRKAISYLSPKNNSLLIGYSTCEELSKSEVINTALKAFFQTLSKEQREKYIKMAAKLEAEKEK